jgi:hypothetical protein
MSQILHIFRKDVRHMWWEILVSLALLGLYTSHEPETWSPLRADASGFLEFLWNIVPALVPLAWGFIIVRDMQEENLVGDRQFWVTRPYDWYKLLAAKILFILAFVNLPLFIVDVILLREGGFAIPSHIGGLLGLQVTMCALAFLPIITGATVTRNLGQLVLLVIGVVLCMVAIGSIQQAVPDSGMSSGPPGALLGILVFGSCIFVVIWQYMRRAVWSARVMLLGTLLAIILVLVVTPYRLLIDRAFPLPANGESAMANFDFDAGAPHSTGHRDVPKTQKNESIQLPLRVSGIQGDLVAVRGILAQIESPNGFRADSHWQPEFSVLQPTESHFQANFDLDKKAFESIKSTPVTLRVSLALTGYHLTDKRTIVATVEDFTLFKGEKCGGLSLQSPFIHCRAALIMPSYFATIDPADLTCPPEIMKERPTSTLLAYEGLWGDDSDFVSPEISPITTFDPRFWDQNARPPTYVSICPGTKIGFFKPHQFEDSRVEIEVDGIRLDEYLPQPVSSTLSGTGGGIGISVP